MISFEEAYSIVTTNIPVTATERISYTSSNGRILAENVASDLNMPPFDKAAVDGFACRKEDLHQFESLQLLEVIAAGSTPKLKITEGTCSKIMTGAMLPDGANCVIMIEQTTHYDKKTVKILDKRTKENIAYLGEDIQDGAIVLSNGTLIKPQHIAVLAAVGAIQPLVYKRVRVSILSTGDELTEPEIFPGPGKIRNSNSSQLVEQAIALGAEVRYGGIVADDPIITSKMIKDALKASDVVILSGGISMGDFDYIPTILKEENLEILIKSIAVQPGKPTVFARSGEKFVLGLPGNPVSSFNIFELLAKPLLYKMMGYNFRPSVVRLPLFESFSRKATGRLGFVPATLNENGQVCPVGYHGSAHINALSSADVLFMVPLGIQQIQAGELVNVRFI
jgi:molybdopterin molybdotransferase